MVTRSTRLEEKLAVERRANALRYWKSQQPCRAITNAVDLDGSCLRCDAAQGEHCRKPNYGVPA